jgi:hypothetical protein
VCARGADQSSLCGRSTSALEACESRAPSLANHPPGGPSIRRGHSGELVLTLGITRSGHGGSTSWADPLRQVIHEWLSRRLGWGNLSGCRGGHRFLFNQNRFSAASGRKFLPSSWSLNSGAFTGVSRASPTYRDLTIGLERSRLRPRLTLGGSRVSSNNIAEQYVHAARIGGGKASNHRLERAVKRGWLCAASALRHLGTGLRPAAQAHR